MQGRVKQEDEGNGLLGIRTGVWLTVLGFVFLCVLAASRFGHSPMGPTGRTAATSNEGATEDAAASLKANDDAPERPRMARQLVSQGGVGALPALTAEEARSLACSLANQKAKELFNCEPFRDGPPARVTEHGWIWSDCRAQGHADIEATVRFGLDGSAEKVDVFLLDSSLRSLQTRFLNP